MKIRTHILAALITGGLAILGGVQVYADTPIIIDDDVPGVLKVNRISPDKNELAIIYYDTGTVVDTPMRLNIQYPNNGSEPDEKELGMAVPVWMTQLYDKAFSRAGAITLISDAETVVTGANMISGTSLKNNESGLLYLALATNPGDGSIRTINVKVDYRECMNYYQADVECIARDTEQGTVYEPWLNGEKLANIEINDGETEPEPSEPSEPTEPTEPSEPEPSESSEPFESTELVEPEPNNIIIEPTRPEPIVALTESIRRSGGDNNVSWTQTSQGNAMTEETIDSEPAGDKTALDNEEQEVEVPVLGGETDSKKKWGFAWWVVVPFVAAGVGLFFWWLIPFMKRRKNDEDDD